MLGQERIRQIAEAILSHSTADQTEFVFLGQDEALTRFANSTVHQNVAQTDGSVVVRVVVDGSRIGVATTNDLSLEALEGALESALQMARLQPRNPDFQSLPGPQPIAAVTAFSEATAGCAPDRRAQGAGAICLLARAAGAVASGAVRTAVQEIAVANSLGTFAYFPTTCADAKTVVMSDTGAGYAAAVALDVSDLNFEALGREAVEKCLRSQNPKAIEAGDYPVVLEPYAVQDFLQMMTFTGFGALALQEGRSFMAGRLGQQLVDARVSIWDDGLDPAGLPMPFDFEGVPKQRVDLIERGVARGVVYDSYRAGKEKDRSSTGHALPVAGSQGAGPGGMGPAPINLFFEPGDVTLEEMIASTERGLYVTRFHYTRPVEPRQVVITGMTRDGTFLIENGEIAYPVKNLRFTQGYLEALNHVEMIGREARLLLGMRDVARDSVPALKLGRFTFTGTTEF